mgnify:CR=1 FL=1
MKLSNETLNVLKNFANINSGIEFKKGKVLKTISPGKGLLATATLNDAFEDDFCVVDHSRVVDHNRCRTDRFDEARAGRPENEAERVGATRSDLPLEPHRDLALGL